MNEYAYCSADFFVRVFRHFSAVHHTETNLLKTSLEIEVTKIIFNLLEM